MFIRGKTVLSDYVMSDMVIIHKLLNLEFGFNILEGGRKRERVDARRVFVQILHKKYGLNIQGKAYTKLLTLEHVASYIGYNNHSSVIHLLRNFEALCAWDNYYKLVYDKVLKQVGDTVLVKENSLLEQKRMLLEQIQLIDDQLILLKDEQKENKDSDPTIW